MTTQTLYPLKKLDPQGSVKATEFLFESSEDNVDLFEYFYMVFCNLDYLLSFFVALDFDYTEKKNTQYPMYHINHYQPIFGKFHIGKDFHQKYQNKYNDMSNCRVSDEKSLIALKEFAETVDSLKHTVINEVLGCQGVDIEANDRHLSIKLSNKSEDTIEVVDPDMNVIKKVDACETPSGVALIASLREFHYHAMRYAILLAKYDYINSKYFINPYGDYLIAHEPMFSQDGTLLKIVRLNHKR